MKIFVVDTNVLWSTVYNAKSPIGQFVLAVEPSSLKLYAPEFLKVEIERHFPKILALSNQPEMEVREVLSLAYQKIEFVEDRIIPFEHYARAAPLVRDVDPNDLVFVALTEFLDAFLWTGDVKLLQGLRAKGYSKVVSFEEVKELLKR